MMGDGSGEAEGHRWGWFCVQVLHHHRRRQVSWKGMVSLLKPLSSTKVGMLGLLRIKCNKISIAVEELTKLYKKDCPKEGR
ncbi:hypothetical protein QJS04_geneDACA015901 [Acorus gramineus]|uniref:Uncharacterized protein n=1 Tax=Acorus gramineus TaxID=55184 RepID=A0AAV9BRX9_ACOGR|nr:hypothetical protein QJS04_geneDACA015901 [Acorus gramineus]